MIRYSYLCYLECLLGTHLDAFPNQLTPMEESLYLVDGGFSINSPFPLVLQPERDVDVILSFNFSWEAPFEVRDVAEHYYMKMKAQNHIHNSSRSVDVEYEH